MEPPISPTPALSRGYEVTSPTPPSWIAWYPVSPVSSSSSFPSLLEPIPHLPSHQTFTLKPVSIHLVLIYFHSLASNHIHLPSQSTSDHLTNTTNQPLVTRSHKSNDREHQAEGMMGTRDNLPRYFAKSGPTDADPRKTKKDGGGKGNW